MERQCTLRSVLAFGLLLAGLVTAPVPSVNAHSPQTLAVTQTTGGPDNYGYTWNDTVPYAWIDAQDGGYSAGIGAPLGAVSQGYGIDLGFTFPFYENAYSRIIPSTAGVIGFDSASLGFSSGSYAVVPTPDLPNNFIAPLFYGFGVNNGEYHGNIYYKAGGTAPNRYFVMEWYQVRDSVNTYTFEAVLYESGNIDFTYQNVNQSNGSLCSSTAGIEDASGYDGLAYKQYGCNSMTASTGHTVRFTRPAHSAHVLAYPRADGQFAYPGQTATFTETLYNKGDFGTDTVELSATSVWPVLFYGPDGYTPLTNTNGSAGIDSGAIPQGTSKVIVIKVIASVSATVGMTNTIQVTARSALNAAKSQMIPLQMAVPAPFAQAGYRLPGASARLNFYRPYGTLSAQTVVTDIPSMEPPALATTPDGNVVQVYTNAHYTSVYYSVHDQYGSVVRPVVQLTHHVDGGDITRDQNPVVAVAPNGNVGIAFRRASVRSSDLKFDSAIQLLILNSAGDQVASVSVADAGWVDTLDYYMPAIAATSDNRFVLAWAQQEVVGTQNAVNSYYAVYATDGQVVKALARFSDSPTSCMGGNAASLTSLSDGSVLFLLTKCDGLYLARLSGTGSILLALTRLATSTGGVSFPDATQLSNGNIVLAWSQRAINDVGAPEQLAYAVLNSSLGTVKGATPFAAQSPTLGDIGASVVPAGNRAVLTWSSCCMSMPHLYYALVDSAGTQVTPPMPFDSDYSIEADTRGQASTFLLDDLTPPANPVLSSTSHTVGAWSNNNVISVTLSNADSDVDGYAVVWDHSATSLPPTTTKTYEQNVTSIASSALADGEWYFHLRAVDKAGNWAVAAAHLGPFKIDRTAPTSVAVSAPYAAGAFTVTWSGADIGSGIASYDVWVRDGQAGIWNAWLTGITTTNVLYVPVTMGHTYYFRSQAHDNAGNVELPANLPADGDTHTRIALYQVSGHVYNPRGQGVFHAGVLADPAAIEGAFTDDQGAYSLFFDVAGVYTLTAQHINAGALPPIYSVPVTGNLTGLDFVLPPKLNAVADGAFEAGSVSAWGVTPGLSATLEISAAYSGRYGLKLQAQDITLARVTGSAGGPCITQSVTIQAAWQRPTLSWMARVLQGNTGDALVVSAISGTTVVSQSVALMPGGWTQGWLDLSALRGQTATVCIGFAAQTTPQAVDIDDVSVGDSPIPVYRLYMPIIRR